MSSKTSDYQKVYKRWCAHIERDEGPTKYVVGLYHYDGDTMFHEGRPWQRLLKNPDGVSYMLVKHDNYELGLFVEESNHLQYPRVYLPCIGVFSRYPQDRMVGEELFERLRYILTCALRELTLEVIPSIRTDKLMKVPSKWDSDPVNSQGWLVKRITRHYERYDWINKVAKPGWPEMPRFYASDAVDLMHRKVEAWNEPEMERKRLRVRARKLANKVLDAE